MLNAKKVLNILVTFDISSIAGRDQMAGVLRYMHTRPNWMPVLLSRPADFTPETVANAGRSRIDGIIANHAGSTETEAALAASRIPLAVVGIRNPVLLARQEAIAFTQNDNIGVGRLAARHFRSLGKFRSFGYIPASESDSEWSLSREEGFREGLEAKGAGLSVFSGDATNGTCESRKRLADWLRALPKPAAILAAWDYPAMQALEICRAEGIPVPGHVALLGVDNDPLVCESTIPTLSSIPFDYGRQGYESAAALDAILSNPGASPMTVVCHPLPVAERGSAAPIVPAAALLRKALKFIAKNAAAGISTRDVANALGVSQSLLTLRFREYAGGTVMDAVLAARLERAKHLLATSDRPIAEVSAASGFVNPNYAKGAFRRLTGMTMSEYRRSHRQTAQAGTRKGSGLRWPLRKSPKR